METIKRLTTKYIENLGYELVDVTLSRDKSNLFVRFIVDRPKGGISIDECAKLNQSLGNFLDQENIIGQSYILEVSSPGLDRPLKTEKDFLRAIGRRVRVFLAQAQGLRFEIEGVVDSVDKQMLALKIENRIEQVPIKNIIKVKQVII